MGDFNAKIRNGREKEYVGPHGLSKRNDIEDWLSIFAKEHQLVELTFSGADINSVYSPQFLN